MKNMVAQILHSREIAHQKKERAARAPPPRKKWV